MKRIIFLLSLIGSLVFIFSCSAEIDLKVKLNSSGTAEVIVDLEPVLTQYLFDLQSVWTDISPEEAEELFDPQKTKELLEKSNTVSVLSMDSTDKNKIKMVFGFKTLNEVLDEGNRLIEKEVQSNIQNVVNMTISKDNIKKVTFHLDKENFASLIAVIPPEAQSLVASFKPPQFEVTREDYVEMLMLNFEEYNIRNLKSLIENSKLRLNIEFDGKLISFTGGEKKGGKLVVEIDLLDLLILNEPFIFEIKFK